MKTEIVLVLPHGRCGQNSLANAIEQAKKWSLKLEKEIIVFARSKKERIELKATFNEGRLLSMRTKWNRRIIENSDNESLEFYDAWERFLNEVKLWK